MSCTKLEYLAIQPRHELLAVELIAAIIDIVADGYRDSLATQREPLIFSTLAAASLVSRTWNTICSAYIFRTIKITAPGDPGAQLSFLHFEAPHLSGHIHKLKLKWDGRCTNDDWLSDCFRQMKNLRELRLHGAETINEPYVAPVGMKPMLAAPYLRRLVLCGWYFAEDGSDLVGMLPDTVEELVLKRLGPPPQARSPHAFPNNTVAPDSNANTPSSTGRRLENLRSMELIYIFLPLLNLKTFIECPNLRRFSVGWSELESRWDLPQWIPASLWELSLETNLYSHIPHFGASIQPSDVKIGIWGHEGPPPPYGAFLPRIRACIDRLPSPHLIQALTIDISNYENDSRNRLYPKLSDYEALSQYLQQLRSCKGGKLKAIFLNIKMELEGDEDSIDDKPASVREWLPDDESTEEGTPAEDGGLTEYGSSDDDFSTGNDGSSDDEGVWGEKEPPDDNELHVDEARETAKLEKGFPELLKDNMLNVEFTLERLSIWSGGGGHKVLMHCSIRTM
ncbi:hypothetical protein PC9H_010073 [Pleurotus ostreatus]|uniref:Uncharacterized protein n=1 Tax=Pleurotus ostreatus TaxID=5322 RepID=A0A8H6ZQW9_PLEOS|nr:uncharacterized protein PC9H_010073 [Pleurotus ostreatus]KAF7424762.1 hypothetical protein PC9H_010073 [Pleurotus ostreatus]KAJ8692233.1 hypothetical protein PTI98_009566 [Pleurotus ostreatus]